jgi:primosomal protein N' (replication factor Y)
MVAGGLRLKREVINSAPLAPRGDSPVANIWVDSSVYHLDSTFSYLIPANLADTTFVGSSVLVPFNGREIEGVVHSFDFSPKTTGLKSISKVIGSIPLL